MAGTIRARVTLNGTDRNLYERLGLKANPFPQVAKHEYAHLDAMLSDLDATPMPSVEALSEWLKERGAEAEFVLLCRHLYRQGEIVTFHIAFPEGS